MTQRIYSLAGSKGAFSGIGNLSRETNRSTNEVKRDLEKVDTYTLTREIKRPRFYNPYFVWQARKLMQIDLIDFSKDKGMINKNGGNRYLFCAIDSFTRFAWVAPMKRKNQKEAVDTYNTMSLEFGDNKPQRILCDSGGEFISDAFRRMLTRQGTHLIALNRKAGTVERFQRSLQSLIYKFIAHTGSKRFIHRLPDLLKTYNNRYHRIIKMTPSEAEREENLPQLRENLKEYYDRVAKKKPRFAIGDKVRVKIRRSTFTRGYKQTFSDEVYRISRINTILPRPTYHLTSLEGDEAVPETFYGEELQRLGDAIFKKIKILSTKRGEDGQVKRQVRVTLGNKNKALTAWFSESELRNMRRR